MKDSAPLDVRRLPESSPIRPVNRIEALVSPECIRTILWVTINEDYELRHSGDQDRRRHGETESHDLKGRSGGREHASWECHQRLRSLPSGKWLAALDDFRNWLIRRVTRHVVEWPSTGPLC